MGNFGSKLITAEPQPKLTGSYKKESVIIHAKALNKEVPIKLFTLKKLLKLTELK